jgi:hypothetical protein
MRRARVNPRRLLRTLGLGLLGAAVLLGGPLAAKSQAGTYTATECASSNPYSEAQPGEYGHHFFGLNRDCTAGGGGLNISLPQAYWAWGYARWTVYAPVGTHMVNVSGAQQGVNADNWYVQLYACSPSDCGANVYVSGDGYWRSFGTPSGYYTNWFIQLICGPGTCFGSTAAGAHVRDVTMTMSDDVAPTVSEGGELLSGEVQRGTGRLDAAPTDVGAGLTSAWVLINDQEVAKQNYGCTGVPMQPCARAGGPANFDLDTQRAPFHDGKNDLQVCAADYGAPPNVTCTPRRAIGVDNSCRESNVPGGSNLSAVFPRTRKDVVGVKAGQGALLTGELADNSGDPVAGATLCMKEGVAGQGLEGVGTVTTNSAGHYRYGVAPGPNRRLQVGYRYNRHQLEREARFFSKLRPKLMLSPKRKTRNGETLRLYGSIPGPSNDGRVVILQARYPHSKRWSTFAKAKTGRHGNYVAGYLFTATFTTTEYGMRAVVPEQNGYPYEGGASRVKTIKVIGRRPG